MLREAFRRGERPALAKVYDEYARSVFSLLVKGFSFKTGESHSYFKGYRNSWQLENAVQEVFTRAFSEQARLAYDGLRPYRNYLFAIARNYIIDLKRKNRSEFMSIDELPEHRIAEHGQQIANPEQATEEKQLQRDIDLFVSQLSEKERGLFELRFRQGRSIEAVAEELKATEYWIKRQEKKIKKRFFHWMRERGYFEGYSQRTGRARSRFAFELVMFVINGA